MSRQRGVNKPEASYEDVILSPSGFRHLSVSQEDKYALLVSNLMFNAMNKFLVPGLRTFLESKNIDCTDNYNCGLLLETLNSYYLANRETCFTAHKNKSNHDYIMNTINSAKEAHQTVVGFKKSILMTQWRVLLFSWELLLKEMGLQEGNNIGSVIKWVEAHKKSMGVMM